MTDYGRALTILNEPRRMTLVAYRGIFHVEGDSGVVSQVRLFPTASCNCPVGKKTRACYHILLCKKAVGMTDISTKLKNATSIRRAAQSKKQRLGRKPGNKTSALSTASHRILTEEEEIRAMEMDDMQQEGQGQKKRKIANTSL